MKSALLHVSVTFLFCVAVANTSLFSEVLVDLSYEHYAEQTVDPLPPLVAMPCNCLVNLAYVFMGLYWLLCYKKTGEPADSCYLREVFALMAVFYGPVQWTRLATLRRAPAVLDQWFTLPIFAWVIVWVGYIERQPGRWRHSTAAAVELCSVLSYGLALVHAQGFEVALAGHVLLAVYRGARVHMARGNSRTGRYLLLATMSCVGFVALKLLDHRLARLWLFQRFTGHFWSKVCDVLQFHYSFCFLTAATERAREQLATKRGE